MINFSEVHQGTSESLRDSSNFPALKLMVNIFRMGVHVPTSISAPASAKALAMAQPKPWSSPIPAIKAFFSFQINIQHVDLTKNG